MLHVATSADGRVVGCCSSTLFAPWCEPGCGHWGLLAVGVSHQGGGVATALVNAAERRLATEGTPEPEPELEPEPEPQPQPEGSNNQQIVVEQPGAAGETRSEGQSLSTTFQPLLLR